MNGSTADTTQPLFRYAPTPSGFLHEGNICNFLLIWVLAKATNGKILLRIDDLDRERFRMSYLEDIFRKLDTLNLDYDLGPSGPDDFNKNWSQQHRLPLYNDFLGRLSENDRLYACKCSRKEIESGALCVCHYSKHSLNEVALRFNTSLLPAQQWTDLLSGPTIIDAHQEIPNFILRKKNGMPSYQIASIADDVHFNVTDIVRGEDLRASTAAQLLISAFAGNSEFHLTHFYHHSLVKRADGGKLSKSSGDRLTRFGGFRNQQTASVQVIRSVANWLKVESDISTKEELLDAYRSSGNKN